MELSDAAPLQMNAGVGYNSRIILMVVQTIATGVYALEGIRKYLNGCVMT
jgi:hypothetical protein